MRLDPFPDTFFTQAGCIQSTNCSSLNGLIWDEYRHRFEFYLNANKVTEDEYKKLGGILNE